MHIFITLSLKTSGHVRKQSSLLPRTDISTAGSPIMPFCSMLLRPHENLTCLHQLAYSKVGFVIHLLAAVLTAHP